MKKQIAIHNENITYTIRKSRRARRMRLAVYCDGTVVVTTPIGLKETIVEKFIREKSTWLLNKILFFKQVKSNFFVKSNKRDYLKYKEHAYNIALDRIKHFNKVYKFKFNKINIKNQKTRWGSCSRKGNLNFNYKIAILPTYVSDYVIVHELCHLGEFNHSQKFWRLVEKGIPNYLEIRNILKNN
jgi:predicted metal-dependent hydrolase